MKKLLLVMSMLCAVTAVYPQARLGGTVTDAGGKPLQGAQVILSTDSAMAAFAQAGADGRYEISGIEPGEYKAEVSMLGYAPEARSLDIEGDMEADFALTEDAHVLDTLTVEAERPRVTTATGHIYYLSKAARECGDPFKALQEIPDLISNSVTQSVASVDGQPLMVLVDGVMINSGIAPIDPKRIDYVEINDVVSARYIRMGVKKILNIRLKPQRAVYTFYEYGLRNDFPAYFSSTWGKLEVGNDKLSFYMDFGPELTHGQKSYRDVRTVSDSYVKSVSTRTERRSTLWDYTAMLKYRPTEKDYLAAYFQGDNGRQHSKARGTGTFDGYAAGASAGNGLTTRYSGDSRSTVYAGTLFYRRMINDRMDFENYLSGTYNYNRLETDSRDAYPAQVWEDASDFRTRRTTLSQSADFSWDVNDNTAFSAGNSTTYTYDKLTDVFSANPVYRHKEWNEFVYATLSGRLAGFLFMLSAGYEGIWRTSAGVFDRYARPYGVATVVYDFGRGGSLSGQYNSNSAPPQVSMLNPYDTSTDSLRRNVGNPYLKPQNTQGAALRYSFYRNGFYANAGVDYTYISDRFETVGYTDGDGVYTSTYANLGRYSNFTLNCSAGYRSAATKAGASFEQWFEYFPGMKAKKSFSVSAYAIQSLGRWTLYAKAGYANYSFTNISATRNLTPTSYVLVSYQCTPNLSLSVGTNSVIKYSKARTRVIDDGYELHMVDKREVFHPFFLLRWTLRKNVEKKIKLDNGIMKDIQKGINLQDRKY